MRMGVLDIGSNTGHLLVVDGHRGAAPLPAYSHKQPLRLAEHLDGTGAIDASGVDALVGFVAAARRVADDKGAQDVLAFATSAVRGASNADAVLERVHEATGVRLSVLPGRDEARLTFLAVRRWFGWSAGRVVVFDIGGGSLEIAAGAEETPDVAISLPLGAGRLTRERLGKAPVSGEVLRQVRKHVRAEVAQHVGQILRLGRSDRAVATSKTFRSLARICGAAPSAEGPLVRRVLSAESLRSQLPALGSLKVREVAALPGVSVNRAHQVLAGALVADAVMDLFDVAELEVCPWALREGVILERLDQM